MSSLEFNTILLLLCSNFTPFIPASYKYNGEKIPFSAKTEIMMNDHFPKSYLINYGYPSLKSLSLEKGFYKFLSVVWTVQEC